MWRRSRRFTTNNTQISNSNKQTTNQQHPNLELQQNKPQTNNAQSWNSNQKPTNQQHPKLELQPKNHKPTTPKAGTPRNKLVAGGEATTTEQYMMKTTRSYRIGTSRIKHRCNIYKNNYYKKKKKKKSGVQAGCEKARVVWEKEEVGFATYSLHPFSICHCSISYLLLTGPHHPNLLPRNHSDRHARSGKQTGICADLSPKTLRDESVAKQQRQQQP